MKNKEFDIFEPVDKSNYDNGIQDLSAEWDNPFINIASRTEQTRHLNDYDSDILKEGAYRDIEDDVFKLEYKISRTEDDIKNIEAQIYALREINDYNKITELQNRLDILKSEHNKLLALYNDKTLSAKITNSFASLTKKTIGKSLTAIKSAIICVMSILVPRMPKKISSAFRVKKALYVLENINRNVDKLVKMSVPYGENINKYQQLSKYIVKANSIQSEISGYLSRNN